MARSYGKTYLSIWGDGDFRALHPDAQRMYLFLTSQQDLSCVGTIPLRINRWANCAADQTAQQVRSALAELARGNFIVVDECTEEVLVRSFVRRDEGWKSPNMMKSIVSTARTVMSESLRAVLCSEISRIDTSELSTKINAKTERSTKDFIDMLIAAVEKDLRDCEVAPEVANWGDETLTERVTETLPETHSETLPENGQKPACGNPSRNPSRKGSLTAITPTPSIATSIATTPADFSPEQVDPCGFNQFYDAYPRHMKRADAEKAWRQAVKRATPEEILAGARRLRVDPNLPEKNFIPYPATWLRADGWNDEPLPPRNSRQTNGLTDNQWQQAFDRAVADDRAAGRIA